jgi:hypothetical protein
LHYYDLIGFSVFLQCNCDCMTVFCISATGIDTTPCGSKF